MYRIRGPLYCKHNPYLLVILLYGYYVRAVLDSRNNLANQEVFRIAKAADHHGFRTVGIMTKLDASQQGDEPAVGRNVNYSLLQ